MQLLIFAFSLSDSNRAGIEHWPEAIGKIAKVDSIFAMRIYVLALYGLF